MRFGEPAVVCLLFTVACQPTIPHYTVHVPPRLSLQSRPERSVVLFRGDLPLDDLGRAIEKSIPPRVNGRGQVNVPILGEVEAKWDLERQPVSVQAQDGRLGIEVALLGKISVAARGYTCRSERAGLALHGSAKPAIHSSGELALDGFQLEPRPSGDLNCNGFLLPSGAIMEAILSLVAKGLGLVVERVHVPLGPFIRQGLEELSKPHPVTLPPNQQKGCIDLDAGALVLAPLDGEANRMKVKVGLDVAPVITLGDCLFVPSSFERKNVFVRTVPLEDSFRLEVSIAVPYREIEERVVPLAVGRDIGNSENAVRIDTLELGDASGHVLVRVGVSGALSGIVYLWGTPTITEKNGRFFLTVPDLRASVETQSALQRFKLGVWALHDGGLSKYLRDKISFDVTDRINEIRNAINQLGKRELVSAGPKLKLNFALERIIAGSVTSSEGTLLLRPVLIGSALVSD